MNVEELLGELPKGWAYTTLGEACRQGGGDIQTGPFGSQLHASDYVPTGIPSIMPQNIGDNYVSDIGIARITERDAARLARYRVKEGDIVYSRRGDVERRALIRAEQSGWLCGTGCLRVRPGPRGLDSRYIAYYLGHPAVREWIVRHAQGATMANLNTSILSACPCVVPSKEGQIGIASMLATLDDKIDLNQRINKTLEAMARAIFKEWFVDFGPTRAKAEGLQPSGLSAEIAALFPDALDDEDKPVGWILSPVGDEVSVTGGSTPSTENLQYWTDGAHSWATPKDLSKLRSPVLLSTERKITDAGVGVISSGLLPPGTVLLSSRAPIGYLAIAEVQTAINQGFIAMVCNKKLSNLYMLFWARENTGQILSKANGSTFQEISKSNFRPIPIIVPSSPVLNAFESVARPMYEQIVNNERQSQTLAGLRDILLPKLMSGEISLMEGEPLLREAL